MSIQRHLPKRIPTLRTSTVWPFLYTCTKQGIKQVVFDAAAPLMEHPPASASPARVRRQLEVPTGIRRRPTNGG